MPVVSTKRILDDAFARRYGVAAFNIVNDLTLDAVMQAAESLAAPVIIQTSVKTVQAAGAAELAALFRARAGRSPVPAALHLDHCPDRAMITTCLAHGWNSVLFDASALSLDENTRQTIEVVAEARRAGADVEGEIESVRGVEDGIGSDDDPGVYAVDASVAFIRATGVDFFAPAVGTAHGLYKKAPRLDAARLAAIVAQAPLPMVLHGGTGLSAEQFAEMIANGCAKVNISTALKIAYFDATRAFLAQQPTKSDPPSLFRAQHAAIVQSAVAHIKMFGSEGMA
jgi:fructose-bisphosphate aldolase class II